MWGTPRVSGSVCHVPAPEIGSVRVARLHALATYRGTSFIMTASSLDPKVGLCQGPYGGPSGGGLFLMGEVPHLGVCTEAVADVPGVEGYPWDHRFFELPA